MKTVVITPTLGKSRWLDAAVASVSALPVGCGHVLVCPESVRADLARRFPHAQVVTEAGGGMYAAINAGLDSVQDWAAFTYLNDDDIVAPEGFATALAMQAAQSGLDVIYGRVQLIDSAGKRLGMLPVARRTSDLAALMAGGIMPLAQPGTLIGRQVWGQLKGLDESYRLAGDLDFFARALAAGARFAFVDATVAAFRLRAGQLSKQGAAMAQETARALQVLSGTPSPWSARWRFRMGNLGSYFERIRRHGWISMRELQERVG